MLTFEQAKEIGIEACIDKIGREYVRKYKDTSCPAYADMDEYAYCFLGVDNTPGRYDTSHITLDSKSKFPVVARCTVNYKDGEINFLECTLP